MREARAKLRLIKPEDMDMEEYMVPSLGWTDVQMLKCLIFLCRENIINMQIKKLV